MQDLADQIHAASLAILADPGIRLRDATVLERLRQAGVTVDGDRVHFDEDQVMAGLSAAPAEFRLAGGDSHRHIRVGADSRCMAPAYGAPTITLRDGRRRAARFTDYLRIARLVQAADLLHLNGGILVQPADLDPAWAGLAMLYAALCLSDKPLVGIQGDARQVRQIMELAARAAGGVGALRRSPRLLFLVSTLSPLQIDGQALATLRLCAEYRQPVVITPGLMFGSTGPISPAGSMVQANAEFLAGLCVSQAFAPGLPVVYGCLGSPADLRTGGVTLASPSRFSFKELATHLARRYALPNRGIGAVTDAAQVSVQSGYEAMLTLSSDYRHSTSIVLHAAGILQRFASFSYEQFMVDLEIIRMLDTAAAPSPAAWDLALEVIRQVGPGGEFLTHPHTLKHCRSLLFDPALSPPHDGDPGAFDALIDKGLAALAAAYAPPGIAPDRQSEMDAYVLASGVPATVLETVRRTRRSPETR
ncbi:MAG: trimethylamine methyltransferase family protein [Desulfosarcinaceae bacterium]|nr:trimethylamine methyltransferase family protein [Desulfosarcinaceae bacterium]